MLQSCFPTSMSFRDGSMPVEWKTFKVLTLENKAANAPLDYGVQLTEELKDGIQNRTSLSLLGNDAKDVDLEFSGVISNYSVTPMALQDNDEAAKNRLTITSSFEILVFGKNDEEDEIMTVSSSRFSDFDSTSDLESIEAALLEEINDQIVQDVINKLLSDW